MENGGIAKLSNGRLEYLFKEISEEKNGRFNDVIADPEGRVFCGTMPDQNGNARLYKLDTDGTLTKVLDGIKLSNGLGFSPESIACISCCPNFPTNEGLLIPLLDFKGLNKS